MSELARRRRARDLWISRGHLWALGAAVVLIGVIAFTLGATLVGGTSPGAVDAAAATTTDESLVDLLARVDNRAVAQDGVDTLTFPDTLSGVADDPAVPTATPDSRQESVVAPGGVGRRPFDLVLHTDDDAQAAVLAAALVGSGWSARVETGDPGSRVIVDGGDDLETARDRQAQLRERLVQLGRDAQPDLTPR